jgi:hypothetical protein
MCSTYWICFPQSPDDLQYQINRIPTDLDRTLHFTPLDAPYHFLTSLSLADLINQQRTKQVAHLPPSPPAQNLTNSPLILQTKLILSTHR